MFPLLWTGDREHWADRLGFNKAVARCPIEIWEAILHEAITSFLPPAFWTEHHMCTIECFGNSNFALPPCRTSREDFYLACLSSAESLRLVCWSWLFIVERLLVNNVRITTTRCILPMCGRLTRTIGRRVVGCHVRRLDMCLSSPTPDLDLSMCQALSWIVFSCEALEVFSWWSKDVNFPACIVRWLPRTLRRFSLHLSSSRTASCQALAELVLRCSDLTSLEVNCILIQSVKELEWEARKRDVSEDRSSSLEALYITAYQGYALFLEFLKDLHLPHLRQISVFCPQIAASSPLSRYPLNLSPVRIFLDVHGSKIKSLEFAGLHQSILNKMQHFRELGTMLNCLGLCPGLQDFTVDVPPVPVEADTVIHMSLRRVHLRLLCPPGAGRRNVQQICFTARSFLQIFTQSFLPSLVAIRALDIKQNDQFFSDYFSFPLPISFRAPGQAPIVTAHEHEFGYGFRSVFISATNLLVSRKDGACIVVAGQVHNMCRERDVRFEDCLGVQIDPVFVQEVSPAAFYEDMDMFPVGCMRAPLRFACDQPTTSDTVAKG